MINTSPVKVKRILKILKNDTSNLVANFSVSSDIDLKYCYTTLNKVSRSFALVIQDLPVGIKDAICVFYLVLRALDTIEDDMKLDLNTKKELLKFFHLHCADINFSLQNVGDKKVYVELMANYPKVARVFQTLSNEYQTVIQEITEEMAKGMLVFIDKEVETKKDYDLYCHYVAGLVGQGLSKLFVASGLESSDYLSKMDISNSMGLLLQKTNITRDFYEDFDEGRLFWPKEIWGNYTSELQSLKISNTAGKSIACLNKMVENALNHFQDCLIYLKDLKNEKIFRFCAIPQVMAIGTLSILYNNSNALVANVKMSKMETLQIFSNLNNQKDFANFSLVFLEKIKLNESDIAFAVIINNIKTELRKFL